MFCLDCKIEPALKVVYSSLGENTKRLAMIIILLRGINLRFWGGAVASWLVSSTLDQTGRIQALAGDIELCSWARRLTLTVPLSTQVYKWVWANLMLGVTPRWAGSNIPDGPVRLVCRLYLYLTYFYC